MDKRLVKKRGRIVGVADDAAETPTWSKRQKSPTTRHLDRVIDRLEQAQNDKSKRYLGEIVGVIEEQSMHWTCVKLHTVSSEAHQATVDGGQPGPWVEAVPT